MNHLDPLLAREFDRRQVLRVIGALAAVGATGSVAACGTSNPATAQMERPSGLTVRIGLITPALGPYAKIGDDLLKGFKLYLEEHSQRLGTHSVDLRLAEEGATPETAVAAVKGLLNQGVLAIAGVANPAALPALVATLQQAKVPLVSSHTAPAVLTNAFYVWRASHVEGEAGRSLAPFAKSQGGKAYVMYEDTQTGREEANTFRKTLIDIGGEVVGEVSGKVSFPARLQAANSLGATVVFAAYSGADAAALLEAYRNNATLEAKLIGPGTLTETADLTRLGQNLPVGVYTSMFYAADLSNEENRRFVAAYHKGNGVQPTGYAMAAYDSASVIDKALHLVKGPPTAEELNKAFSGLGQIESARGIWAFNANRAPQQRWYLRRLRMDGRVAANLLDTELTVLS